jgi:hypothetical protein
MPCPIDVLHPIGDSVTISIESSSSSSSLLVKGRPISKSYKNAQIMRELGLTKLLGMVRVQPTAPDDMSRFSRKQFERVDSGGHANELQNPQLGTAKRETSDKLETMDLRHRWGRNPFTTFLSLMWRDICSY